MTIRPCTPLASRCDSPALRTIIKQNVERMEVG
jgi:hypothetical protein